MEAVRVRPDEEKCEFFSELVGLHQKKQEISDHLDVFLTDQSFYSPGCFSSGANCGFHLFGWNIWTFGNQNDS